MAMKYEVVKDFGKVTDDSNVKLGVVSWSGLPAKIDLRNWGTFKGITFSKSEIKKLYSLLENAIKDLDITNEGDCPSEVVKDTDKTKDEIKVPKKRGRKPKIKTPEEIEAEKNKVPKKRGRKPKVKATEEIEEVKDNIILITDAKGKKTDSNESKDEVKTETEKDNKRKRKDKEVKSKAKMVQFPKTRPEVEKLKLDGNHTYEECEEKLNKEREIFKDGDSQFVIDGLLEMCKVNQNFRNCVMNEEKSYQKSFEYFANLAKQGYAMKYGGVTYLDNNMALGMAIEYFEKKED